MKGNKVYSIRKEYSYGELIEKTISKNPIKLFETWMDGALEAKIKEPNAMNLCTVNAEGKPSSRIVLLRGFDAKGFVFYTNYLSKKGTDLSGNPNACLNFFWTDLEKQVRIEGSVTKVSKAVSDAYFKSRPRESQIGAWVSAQSSVLKSRDELENSFKNLTKKFDGLPVPRPNFWGGYCLNPKRIEFWQGRTNRLHDRIVFEKLKVNGWKIERLSP